MKHLKLIYSALLVFVICMTGCEDFVEIDTPNFQITSPVVFSDDETASAAVKGIYNQLYHNNISFSNGWENSVTVLAGISGGLIAPRNISHTKFGPFAQHDIDVLNNPAASSNLNLWSSAYNIIYLTNSAIEGLENSKSITEATRQRLMGQVLFIRAFVYFYLVNLYGDVPLLLSTNYQRNTLAPRTPQVEVWDQIESDLDQSILLLEKETEYMNGDRTQVNIYVAKAMQARVCLYRENWIKAEALSSQVISQTSNYEVLDDLDQVFLANSREAIWQLFPDKGSSNATNTNEASVFIIYPRFGLAFGNISLDNDFISEFDISDKRRNSWVKMYRQELYYVFKYKVRSISVGYPEYSMVLRFAEQYLIRAEARAHQDKLNLAIEDLDQIRKRAGLTLISETSPGINRQELLNIIESERKKELFAEWGHRWLDLKRTGGVFVEFNKDPFWEDTDVFYPIPEEERVKNPNLSQNNGY